MDGWMDGWMRQQVSNCFQNKIKFRSPNVYGTNSPKPGGLGGTLCRENQLSLEPKLNETNMASKEKLLFFDTKLTDIAD